MAKKKKDNIGNDNLNDILGDSFIADSEPKKENKPLSIIITALIILIWIGIFIALIKLDVGGFGSKVLSPVLKNVPVVNKILPKSAVKDNVSDDIPYKSIAECAAYIKELENEDIL